MAKASGYWIGECGLPRKMCRWGLHVAVLAGAVVVFVVPLYIYGWNKSPNEYERARVYAAAVSAAIAYGAGLSAVVQYRENSRATRVVRSMEFWRRSNEDYFAKHYRIWMRVTEGKETEERLKERAGEISDDTLAIENILDFFDEACAASMMGVCDDDSLYVYLGPLMEQLVEVLMPFIKAWRESRNRKEKWVCLTDKVGEWEREKYKRRK